MVIDNRIEHAQALSKGQASAIRRRAWAAGCFCLFMLLYGVTSRADVQVSDEAAMFETGVALATKGVLYVDNLRWFQDIINIGETGNGGHLYSKYFPGSPFASALIYRLAARPDDTPYIWGSPAFGYHVLAASNAGARLALRLNALLGALGIVVLFLLVERHFGLPTAIATSLLIGLTTDWWYESRGFFSEVGAGAFMLAALYFSDGKRPYLCSLTLAISLLFRPTGLVALPVWAISLRRPFQRDLPSAVFIIISLGLLGVYNYLRFGSPADFGYGTESFKIPVLMGLIGVLFSPGRSLFFYSPVLILVITGGKLLYEHNRQLAGVVFAVAGAYLLVAAGWHDWWGGKAWGSRLLTHIVPMLGVLLAAIVYQAFELRTRKLILTIAFLGMLGAGIQVLTISQNPVTVLDAALRSGYATDADGVMSVSRNWLALQMRALPTSSVCTLDAYSLRTIDARCE